MKYKYRNLYGICLKKQIIFLIKLVFNCNKLELSYIIRRKKRYID